MAEGQHREREQNLKRTRDELIVHTIIVLDAAMASILEDGSGASPAMDALRAAGLVLMGLTNTTGIWAEEFGVDPADVKRAADKVTKLLIDEDWLALSYPMPITPEENRKRNKLAKSWHYGFGHPKPD